MKAIAVFPGIPNSVHLADLPKPSLEDMPNGRGVLVKVLRVGVDGTDREINAAEYGAAPEGDDFPVIGHESFGQVEAVGPGVTELLPGDYVVATVRRPGSSLYDQIGTYDMTTDDTYYERGINLRHGYLTEYYVDAPDYLVKVPQGLKEVGVLLEPVTVVEKGIAQAYEIQRRLRVWRPLLATGRPRRSRRANSGLTAVAQTVRKQREADTKDLLVRMFEPGVDVVRSVVAGLGLPRFFQERAQRRR
jgi:threonine dehydrogenase-like Zn-dependent dehydrogenase